MPKVSVVIPIYGVEKYIERCAIHLFEQTLEDMEFIFVDDCSKDDSMSVLEAVIQRYPSRKDQIKIIRHEVNKGLSKARQTGVNAANGEYIAHCDSDDWVELNMYELMYRAALEHNSDVVKCGHKKTTDTNVLSVINVYNEGKDISKDDAISWMLTYKGWNSIWDTLVKRTIYRDNNICYTNDAMLEDMYVMSQVLNYANNISIIQQPFYNYFVNPTSICGTTSESDYIRRATQAKKNLEQIIMFVESHNVDKFKTEIVVAKYLPRNILINIMGRKQNYKYWNDTFPEIRWIIYFTKELPIIQKIRLLLVELYLYPFYDCIKKHLKNRK